MKFRKDLRRSIIHSQPEWEEAKGMCYTNNISLTDLNLALLTLKRELLVGRDEELEPYRELIENYINRIKDEEPFAGLPGEIKMNLQKIRDKLKSGAILLEPLTTHIRELLEVKDKERKQMRLYTIGSFLIGILGFLFAIFVYINK